ncbi:ATP-binding protein [Clostridium sp.]|uniref:sensor histidine kinase n=1 Tax=Clostridium sp. TaxID=1506 RepID=UPI003F3FE205
MERLKFNSIKGKLIRNFFILIMIILIFLNILLFGFVKKYYYDNAEQVLKNQIQVSTNFYNRYFSEESLINIVYDNIDAFWSGNNAQVEILDDKGKLLMDSLGVKDSKILNTPDIEKALKGQTSRWVGNVDYYSEKVMIVSSPIISNDTTIGVLRLIVSLENVDSIISSLMVFFLTISIIVLVIAIALIIIMSNNIVEPINSLTKVAEKMAAGNLTIRSKTESNDEVDKLANTLNFMADELEKREQLKNEFISSVSHELRTPLTAIKGWAITLNNEETDKDTLKIGFDIIENETDRLTNMVEELLDFSRLINDKLTLRKEEVNVELFIKHIENYMKPRAKRENLSFSVIMIENTGIAYIDKDRLKQVLINILDNSFKFTESGGKVSLIVYRLDDILKFIIDDTGCGISSSDLPKVKEKFFKGKTSNSKNGIGLSICDEIIKLHKGSFNIESTLWEGTKVEISIPVEGDN